MNGPSHSETCFCFEFRLEIGELILPTEAQTWIGTLVSDIIRADMSDVPSIQGQPNVITA